MSIVHILARRPDHFIFRRRLSNFLEQARVSGAEGKLHHMIIATFVYLLLFCNSGYHIKSLIGYKVQHQKDIFSHVRKLENNSLFQINPKQIAQIKKQMTDMIGRRLQHLLSDEKTYLFTSSVNWKIILGECSYMFSD